MARYKLALILFAVCAWGQGNSASTPPVQAQSAGTPLGVMYTINCSVGTTCTKAGTTVTIEASGTPSSNSLIRSIGAGFDGGGSALTSGSTATTYFFVPFACTLTAWNITVDTGTITFDVWKIANGTAIPTVANTITASALPALASGTALHSNTLTGWTTAVSANDIFGININAVSGSPTKASLILQCNAS